MRILAIRFSGLGDIVMLSGVLAQYRSQYPGCEITLLCDVVNAGIVTELGGVVDHVIALDRKPFRQRRLMASLLELWRVVRAVRRRPFDRVLDFQNFGETGFLTRMARAKEKIGAPKKAKYAAAYDICVPLRKSGHRIQQFARIAQLLPEIYTPRLVLSERAERVRKELAAMTSGPVVGLNIGSSQESRRWSEQHFAELAKRLSKTMHIRVFAGPSEADLLAAFEGIENIDVCTGLDLSQLSGAIASCNVLVSNDTGPAHIAGALQVPLVTLFSTGDDDEVGAVGAPKCYIKRIPINAIDVGEVEARVTSLLEQLSAPFGEDAVNGLGQV